MMKNGEKPREEYSIAVYSASKIPYVTYNILNLKQVIDILAKLIPWSFR